MRTSVIVASVALVALAILVPSDAGCLPHGGCVASTQDGVDVAAKHFKGSKSSAETAESGSCSESEFDAGDVIVKKKEESGSESQDLDFQSCSIDENVVNTGDGQIKSKKFNKSSKSEEKNKSYRKTQTSVEPDVDDCGC